jgi:CheY-specific phosphatase CheX
MNSNHPVLAAEKQHQHWLPFLEFATSEICNMVAGNFKNKISGLGDGCCMLSPTSVITGEDYTVHA